MSGMDDRSFARLERVASGRTGIALVGAWAFAEAIALPIIPDVLIGLLALVVPRRTLVLFAVLIVAALAGTVVMYALALAAPGAVESMLLALPGIPDTMLASAGRTVAGDDPVIATGTAASVSASGVTPARASRSTTGTSRALIAPLVA